MSAQVEELPDNKIRLTVDVPSADVHHAVEHAASDLAESVKIPGFRKGKVPLPVLVSRIGKERLYSEAIESHIAGWYGNAIARARIRPAENPQLDYELPASDDQDWRFTATVSVLPKPAVADWTKLQVPYAEAEVPEDYVDHELNVLRSTVAELSHVEDRHAQQGDTVVTDLVAGSASWPESRVLFRHLDRNVVSPRTDDKRKCADKQDQPGNGTQRRMLAEPHVSNDRRARNLEQNCQANHGRTGRTQHDVE